MPVASLFALLLSLGPLQYGRINVLYYPATAQSNAPDPCVVDVAVFDGTGKQVKTQAFSLSVNGPHSGGLTFTRGDVGVQGIFTARATLEDTCLTSNSNCTVDDCNISSTIEIVDSRTGVTNILVPGVAALPFHNVNE